MGGWRWSEGWEVGESKKCDLLVKTRVLSIEWEGGIGLLGDRILSEAFKAVVLAVLRCVRLACLLLLVNIILELHLESVRSMKWSFD